MRSLFKTEIRSLLGADGTGKFTNKVFPADRLGQRIFLRKFLNQLLEQIEPGKVVVVYAL